MKMTTRSSALKLEAPVIVEVPVKGKKRTYRHITKHEEEEVEVPIKVKKISDFFK
jgi:hypothetical protein